MAIGDELRRLAQQRKQTEAKAEESRRNAELEPHRRKVAEAKEGLRDRLLNAASSGKKYLQLFEVEVDQVLVFATWGWYYVTRDGKVHFDKTLERRGSRGDTKLRSPVYNDFLKYLRSEGLEPSLRPEPETEVIVESEDEGVYAPEFEQTSSSMAYYYSAKPGHYYLCIEIP